MQLLSPVLKRLQTERQRGRQKDNSHFLAAGPGRLLYPFYEREVSEKAEVEQAGWSHCTHHKQIHTRRHLETKPVAPAAPATVGT